MAQIGTFTLKDDVWSGTIRTLTVNTRAKLVPIREKGDGAPDYRLYAGTREIGAAWNQTPADKAPWISVHLDDPVFARPLRAAFFGNEKEGTGILVWNRPKAN